MKIGAILLSRFDSSRLPGKALRQVYGKPIIGYVLERALHVQGIDEIVIATSDREIDEPIVQFATQHEIHCFRGSSSDVAGRFLKCMETHGWEAAVRINGDSPLHSQNFLTHGVEIMRTGKYDFVTNVYPRSFPIGMSVEVISLSAMVDGYSKMTEADHFEHVTMYFYQNPKNYLFSTLNANIPDLSKIRLAVDTIEDLQRFKWLLGQMGSMYLDMNMEKVIELYRHYETQQQKSKMRHSE